MTILLPLVQPSPPSRFPLSSTTELPRIRASSPLNSFSIPNPPGFKKWAAELRSRSLNLALSASLALGLALGGLDTANAKVGVNRPEMLPKEYSPVIDVAGFLSASQERRLCQEIADLEKETGVKLRILAQNYPDTPGKKFGFLL
ncbi:hypothetical protein GW17_00055321 [Ensete ventricosum]|nr:hypothetical protein GW17_00055321 [Ensete ventricosum]